MKSRFFIRLNNYYPQNYILRNPLPGSVLFLTISLLFLITYKPLKMHGSMSLSFFVTMTFYFLASAASIFLLTKLIKVFPYFSNKKDWNIAKEVLAVFLALTAAGIAIYMMGFVLEEPADRWNLATFVDSCKYAFLIGIIPFAFFTLINYRHLFYQEISQDFKSDPPNAEMTFSEPEVLIHICSQLKKEELSFYPGQFLYAESDGNYVIFHLIVDQKYHKEVIRNSLNEISKQLSNIEYFSRIHRAFIVNVKKVRSKKGNALGYKLRLYGTDAEIPVSRQNVTSFDLLMSQFKS